MRFQARQDPARLDQGPQKYLWPSEVFLLSWTRFLGMALAETGELSEITLRSFRPGDETLILEILAESFRGLEYLPRLKAELSGRYFNREGSFIAEKDGSPVGCVGFRNLPHRNWFEIRYLGVRDNSSVRLVAEKLIARAVGHAGSKHFERLKAFVPATQPYVDSYKNAGFGPVRRQLRVEWELTTSSGRSEGSVPIRELSEDMAEEASSVWVEGLRPHWDWWIEEQGGPEAAGSWIKESVGKRENWIGAFAAEKLVGTTLIWRDFYGPGEARFNGVYVLPEFRVKGFGSALMNAAIRKGKQLGQRRMNVYTVAYLDHLAPGAVLYLKSGGRIEAEYLQLERQ